MSTSRRLAAIQSPLLTSAVGLVLCFVATAGCIGSPTASSRTASATTQPPTASPATASVDPDSGLPWIGVSELPAQARETLALIEAGGPFPYDHDGGTFGNREALLPDRPAGHYREYTVETPGSDDRGARRIVAGADGERYYTADHYDSFARIRLP